MLAMEGLLSKLNLVEGSIYEVIVSTYTGEGDATAAPMGITIHDGKVFFRAYAEGSLVKGLKHSRCGVVNFTLAPELFYKTAFKERGPGGKLPRSLFAPSHSTRAPRLRGSDAFLEFTVERISSEGDDQASIQCTPTSITLRDHPFHPYCRGLYASIECVIHATRIRKYLLEGRSREAEDLIRLVQHYEGLAERVAPNTSSTRVIKATLDYIREWRTAP